MLQPLFSSLGYCHVIFGPPKYLERQVQILLKYVFEILGPPSLPRHKCTSWCEDVGYKKSITAMGQTSTVFP